MPQPEHIRSHISLTKKRTLWQPAPPRTQHISHTRSRVRSLAYGAWNRKLVVASWQNYMYWERCSRRAEENSALDERIFAFGCVLEKGEIFNVNGFREINHS